jgi:hypothetical protein
VTRVPYCRCGVRGKRSDRFDAYVCTDCDEWLERDCGDDECAFCSARPERPSDCNDLRID